MLVAFGSFGLKVALPGGDWVLRPDFAPLLGLTPHPVTAVLSLLIRNVLERIALQMARQSRLSFLTESVPVVHGESPCIGDVLLVQFRKSCAARGHRCIPLLLECFIERPGPRRPGVAACGVNTRGMAGRRERAERIRYRLAGTVRGQRLML